MLSREELARRHSYHPPRHEGDKLAHQTVRDLVYSLAEEVDYILSEEVEAPCHREISCFHTALEEASFWAHAALARSRAVTSSSPESRQTSRPSLRDLPLEQTWPPGDGEGV